MVTLYVLDGLRCLIRQTLGPKNGIFSVLPHRVRHFNVEASHEKSLTLVSLYQPGNSFIRPAGRIKTLKTQLYQTCRLLLKQSKILYLYDNVQL